MNRNRKRAARLAERAIITYRRAWHRWLDDDQGTYYHAEFQLARHGFRWCGGELISSDRGGLCVSSFHWSNKTRSWHRLLQPFTQRAFRTAGRSHLSRSAWWS